MYRMETVPRHLPWDAVVRLLEAPDRSSPVGRRDYAILLLLAVYGLRASEVARLTLDDLDWRRSTIRVRRSKRGISGDEPLQPEVGAAIVDYLRHGRPRGSARRLFLRADGVARPFASTSTIGMMVKRHLFRIGIAPPRSGSHTLRHSYAMHLLRQGFSLEAIGDLLGHWSHGSAFAYTKAAVDDLRCVALDVAGLLS
jgi:integrase